ncbi:MAG: hypothetical protein LBT00_03785 [Spirochaetaceae bacterium]|jgi:hypothetical protein|nr:hypothetical protein [Spirochaetaceae bacterium]
MDLIIEFNPAAFKHSVTEADIRWAFDTAVYDGWFNKGEGQDKDKYLLIGFDRNGKRVPCDAMQKHLLSFTEEMRNHNGKND